MKRDVAIVALVNEEEVFLVRTKKYPDAWQPIGGGIEKEDMNPQAAIIREAKEEAGIDIAQSDLQEIMRVPFDFGEGTVYCFSTTIDQEEKLQVNEEEIAEAKWFKLQETENIFVYPATKALLQKLREKAETI